MRVRGRVKLLCPSCVKVKVQVTRDKGYLEVKCSKNPRHNQRTKWPSQQTFSTFAAAQSAGSAEGGAAKAQLPLAWQSFQFGSQAARGLLGARANACLGEAYWRMASEQGL